MRKIYLTLIASLFGTVLCFNSAKAQGDKLMDHGEGKETKVKKEKKGFHIQPSSLGLVVGSSGVGLEFTASLDPRFHLRAGFGYVPKFNYNMDERIGQYNVTNQFRTELFQLHFFGDWMLPVMQGAGFHLTGGVAGFAGAKSKVVTVPVGEYYYGEIPINDDPQRMGQVNSTVTSSSIALYAGIGWQNIIDTRHFGLSVDLGAYYALAAPTVDMTTSGYLVGNEINRGQLQENLKQYRWLPNLQLGFHYKF